MKDPDRKIRAIAAYLGAAKRASRAEIAAGCGVAPGAVGYYLRGLVRLGAVSRSRRTWGARYTWVGPLPPILAVIRASRPPSQRRRPSRAKLSLEQVTMICARRWVGQEPIARLARDYGVSWNAIASLMTGRSHRRTVDALRELHERGRLREMYLGRSVADVAVATASARKA